MESIELVKKLYERLKIAEERIETLERKEDMPVAIVGMSCRFPGADNIAAFWDNLCKGKDAVAEVPPTRWNAARFYDKHPDAPGKSYCTKGAFIDDVKGFDAAFFRINPAEARQMSPQQRILLETTWQALEAANIPPGSLNGTDTAVFLSISDDQYRHLAAGGNVNGISHFSVTGNAISTAGGRIAYQLGLTGTNMVVDTACSSSLVAVDLAARELRSGKTSLAIAGGVNLFLTPFGHISLSKTRALSEDGRCKAFDASADGYGRGEGCGIVVLKRYDDALRDGDHIMAVIRGTAVNQDGASNGMTAPNGLAQERLLKSVLTDANIDPQDVLYIETHGTGTKLGDPIEAEALQQAYITGNKRKHPLYIGSVKTNIGHLESAAGIAALIKTALCLYHKKIPASLHYRKPNPVISWHEQVKVATALTDMPQAENRLAAVSSFGFSGTNVHMVLQSAGQAYNSSHPDECTVLLLSARSTGALKKLAAAYVTYLGNTSAALPDIAYTALHCRDHFEERVAVIAENKAAAAQLLESLVAGGSERLLVSPGMLHSHCPLLQEDAQQFLLSKKEHVYSLSGTRVPVPVYQFDHEEFWVDDSLYRAGEEALEEAIKAAPAAILEDASVALYVDRIVGEITEMSAGTFGDEDDFFGLGMDSIMIMHLRERILEDKQVNIEVSLFYDKLNTPGKLKEYLLAAAPGALPVKKAIEAAFVPYKAPEITADLTPDGKDAALQALVDDVVKRSSSSKQLTQQYRQYLANNRNIAGFKPRWKEMVYQPVAAKAEGAYIWDTAGNRYLDFTMGFGVHLFGYNPPFVNQPLQQVLADKLFLGALSPRAGELAMRICNITGNERAAFYNTGTEAVMVAVRLARAVTQKNRIVIFSGSYHGTYDGILARQGKDIYGEPLAPGVSASVSQDVLVLRYGNEEDLEVIAGMAGEIAAVLVEPVQSRRPDFFPEQFLQQLSGITTQHNIALIFDEVISGFRFAINGIRAFTKVRPDISVYGKIIGGGIPIGVVAGNRRFLDAVDGGSWSYGDQSHPTVMNTFVAGTFCHHPLAMEAGIHVLDQLEANPDIYRQLEQTTSGICDELNTFFKSRHLPVSMVHFGSLFRFVLKGNYELLFYKLLAKGIYIWEGRNCYVSTAHTAADIRYLVDAVKESCMELLEEELITATEEQALPDIKLSAAQQNIWWAWQLQPKSALFNLSETMLIEGGFLPDKFEAACNLLTQRHEILRAVFYEKDGIPWQGTAQERPFKLTWITLPEDDSAAEQLLLQNNQEPFSPGNEWLWRVVINERKEGAYLVAITVHHIVCDGWSMEILFNELIDLYNALMKGEPVKGAASLQYRHYVQEEQESVQDESLRAFWHQQVKAVKPLHIPGATTNGEPGNGAFSLLINGQHYAGIRQLATDLNGSVFTIITAVTQLLLHSYTGATDITTGTPVTGRSKAKWHKLIGHFLNILVLRMQLKKEETFTELLQRLKLHLMEMFEKQDYAFETLKNECWDRRTGEEYPFFEIEISLQNFRLKRHHTSRDFSGLSVNTLKGLSVDPRKYPMEFRFDEGHDDIDLQIHYDMARYPAALVKEMLDDWPILLELALAGRDEPLAVLAGKLKELRSARSKQALHSRRSENLLKLTTTK
ncbi:aminotransferase class III-fold pyridoxal phosphate-dependent enzyme [Chitinophaga filiformis]|uniref:Aminotransferase class III-fold pyridoxal phosphate-dependent enzyme n=1 Tax=Chitinophaga filiformis TaxID=104663 RepID=A0ABY4HT33_CHIFI|nr:aminotransferase class III-fold pyridoxal phosphate-dependent enzyme [Chitinophaga filiformis]UPK66613.1 aminotransferase class III-fold pyridoxal phosphate-dependent enzyme [Chitinophaga filiformis]